jgi:histidinol-phosphate aminotransferase
VTASRSLTHSEMDKVRRGLQRLGFEALPSEANFLYFDAKQDGREVFNALLREGIIVRHIQGSMLRVTIGLPDENQLFLSALESVTRAS